MALTLRSFRCVSRAGHRPSGPSCSNEPGTIRRVTRWCTASASSP